MRVACATLLTAAVVAAAPLSAAPGKQVPFHASFDVVFQSNFVPPSTIEVRVRGEGQASHMGRSQTFTTDQEVDVMSGHGTATYTVVAANGDTMEFFDEIDEVLDGQGGITFEGTYTVVGGTGRFAGATGSGTVVGSAQFTGLTDGIGEFTFDGTISSPGKK